MAAFPRLAGAMASSKKDSIVMPSSCLGRALTVKGRLEMDGEIQVHGCVLGRIDATRLFVGIGGYVEGDIVAQDVHIGGQLIGCVFVQKVTLESTAKITGRIFLAYPVNAHDRYM